MLYTAIVLSNDDEKVMNYKDYINPIPVVPQRLGLNAHGIYIVLFDYVLVSGRKSSIRRKFGIYRFRTVFDKKKH